MLTEILAQELPELLSEMGITPLNPEKMNATAESMQRSVPGLYEHVKGPIVTPKYAAMPATLTRRGGIPAFVKILKNPTPDYVSQYMRELESAKQMTELLATNSSPEVENLPLIPGIIDYEYNSEKGVYYIAYQLIPDNYTPLAAPFLAGKEEGSSEISLARTVHYHISAFQQLGKNFSPSQEMLRLSGYDRTGNWTAPRSIKGMGGGTTDYYLQNFQLLAEQPNYYLVERTGDRNILCRKELDNQLFTRVLNVLPQLLKRLERFNHAHSRGSSYVLCHNDLGAQNMLVNENNDLVFVDLENLTVAANNALGLTSDIAHLISRLWYNLPWQKELIRLELQKHSSEHVRMAFLINLLLEGLRRITRKITYYSWDVIDDINVYADPMIELSQSRYHANLNLINWALEQLESMHPHESQ